VSAGWTRHPWPAAARTTRCEEGPAARTRKKAALLRRGARGARRRERPVPLPRLAPEAAGRPRPTPRPRPAQWIVEGECEEMGGRPEGIRGRGESGDGSGEGASREVACHCDIASCQSTPQRSYVKSNRGPAQDSGSSFSLGWSTAMSPPCTPHSTRSIVNRAVSGLLCA
jgi:hypothetical protein